MFLTDSSGQKWASLDMYENLKSENDILKLNLKVRKAFEIIDKTRKCANASKLSGCNYSDNDTCADCPFYVTGNQFTEAVNVLYDFAKKKAEEADL